MDNGLILNRPVPPGGFLFPGRCRNIANPRLPPAKIAGRDQQFCRQRTGRGLASAHALRWTERFTVPLG